MTNAEPDLSLDDARAEAGDLVLRIESARDAYYGSDASDVDDPTYDGWLTRLDQLEEAHPVLRTQDSPTQTVGAAGATSLDTIEHAERMLSLDNVFSPDELRDWCVKAEASAARKVRWLTELKIDGLAINLRYEDGVLTSAATRGDGRVGEIVTDNATRLAGIPQRLTGEGHPAIVEVRGEVFIPVEEFHQLNAGQASRRERAYDEAYDRWQRVRSAGKKAFDEDRQRTAADRRFPAFANPRNAASGAPPAAREEGRPRAGGGRAPPRVAAALRARHRGVARPACGVAERDLRAACLLGPTDEPAPQGLRVDR